MFNQIKIFFSKPIFRNQYFIMGLWILLAFAASFHLVILGPKNYNNYLIFKHVFWHTIDRVNLYAAYPEYLDVNHYGPVFSLIIAPFALLPDALGIVLWAIIIALVLFYAIKSLPLQWIQIVLILYICAHEMMTAASNLQTNGLIAALIIWIFVSVNKGKDFQAGFFIALGTFIKLYGIVGLCFFFFSKNKVKFVLSCLFWSIVMFVAPMIISSPEFIIQSYSDWGARLIEKNSLNATGLHQDISVMGMFRRILDNRELSNMLFLIPGLLLFALQYIRVNLYNNLKYRLYILSSVLLFVILFSSGSESSGYIIAMTGVAIWFVIQNKPYSKYVLFLLFFSLILTSFSPSDLFPAYLRNNYVLPYALKALPCFMVWLTLLYQIFTARNFKEYIY